MTQVTVRKHTRRRTGRTAQLAERLGFDPTVEVDSYARRRVKPKGVVMIGGEQSAREGLSREAYHQRYYADNKFVAILQSGAFNGYKWLIQIYRHGELVATVEKIATMQQATRMADELVGDIQTTERGQQ